MHVDDSSKPLQGFSLSQRIFMKNAILPEALLPTVALGVAGNDAERHPFLVALGERVRTLR